MARQQKTFGDHPREKKKNVSKTLRDQHYYKNRPKLPDGKVKLEGSAAHERKRPLRTD